MYNRIIALLLCIGMLLGLCACGDRPVDPETPSSTFSTTYTESADFAWDASTGTQPSSSAMDTQDIQDATTASDTSPYQPGMHQNPDARYLIGQILTDRQLQLYNRIVKAVQNYEQEIDFPNCKSTDLLYAFNAANKYNPDLFWFPTRYSMNWRRTGYTLTLYYPYSKEQVAWMSDKLQKAVNDLLTGLPAGLDAYATELYLHDQLVAATEYDFDYRTNAFNAYGALVDGSAVCEGYARAMQLLLHRAGLECLLVNGKLDDEGHMWNIVKVDGQWYHLDPTLNDSDNRRSHAYFNLTDLAISADHTIDRQLTSDASEIPLDLDFNLPVPACSDITACYFVKTNSMIFADDQLESVLQTKLSQKQYVTDDIIEFGFAGSCSLIYPAAGSPEFTVFESRISDVVFAAGYNKFYLTGIPGSKGFSVRIG